MLKHSNSKHFHNSLQSYARSPILVYGTVAICAFLLLLFCFVYSHGNQISRYFWYDTQDTGMDFFYSLQYVHGRQPYAVFSTLYPPLANLLFLAIYRMIPTSVSRNWNYDYWDVAAMRGSSMDLRLPQAPMLMFLLLILVACWMLIAVINSIMKNHSRGKVNLMALCVLISPGVLFALERGNILLLVFPLTLFFVHFRNDQNPVVRELALLSLAVSAGLKLYPALFGVLLLQDKKYSQALRTIVYGIALFLLPCFAFREGISFLSIFWDTLTNFESHSYAAERFLGISFSNILQTVANYLHGYFGVVVDSSLFSIAGFVVTAAVLLSALTCCKNWQRILCITMAMLMFHFQYSYIFCFVSIPMIFFVVEEKRLTKDNIFPFVLMLLLTVNLPLCFISRPDYLDVRIRQIVSLLLVCWCIFQLITFLTRKNTLFRRKK